ncbi:MAG: hypothetical protein OXH92_12040 [Bryobacterales bacterium]|nr:hypothetical protein [Bryobacterales bacterium]MDE0292630.1 hypothetical protein [Bryobacterales bacterium]MDE0434724.1 hypothetical protein [Bryobacterales bacterium]
MISLRLPAVLTTTGSSTPPCVKRHAALPVDILTLSATLRDESSRPVLLGMAL